MYSGVDDDLTDEICTIVQRPDENKINSVVQ
jgi:hypothetical protein